MKKETKMLIIGVVLLAIIGLGGSVVLKRLLLKDTATEVEDEELQNMLDNLNLELGGDATIHVEEIDQPTVQVPSLERFVFDDSVTASMKQKLTIDMGEAIELLQEDELNRGAWLNLSALRALAGDYDGAEEILLFMTNLWPEDRVVFLNLGTLYGDHMKRDVDAQKSFETALKLDDTNVQSYLTYHDFLALRPQYQLQAETVLKNGLLKVPKDTMLGFTLARFYQNQGNSAKARATYEDVLGWAREQSDDYLVSRIEEILATL